MIWLNWLRPNGCAMVVREGGDKVSRPNQRSSGSLEEVLDLLCFFWSPPAL